MSRRNNKSASVAVYALVPVTLKDYCLKYLMADCAARAVKGMKPAALSRLRAVASGPLETPAAKISISTLEDWFIEMAENAEALNLPMSAAFAEKVLAGADNLASKISVDELYRLVEDGEVPDGLMDSFSKMSISQIEAKFPEIHEAQEVLLQEAEAVAAKEEKKRRKAEEEDEKRAAQRLKHILGDADRMVTELVRLGYSVSKPLSKEVGAKSKKAK